MCERVFVSIISLSVAYAMRIEVTWLVAYFFPFSTFFYSIDTQTLRSAHMIWMKYNKADEKSSGSREKLNMTTYQ